MKKIIFSLLAAWLLLSSANAQVINAWRGPNRDGKYPDKNLLKTWPENGPELKWSYATLGEGYTSPTIIDGKIYITGLTGEKGYLYIFTEAGQLIKKIEYGGDIFKQWPGPRSSPLVEGNLCYILSGYGQLVCIDTETEKIVWSKGMFTDFDGLDITFNITENMLIDGDKIYVSPGGKVNNVIALNKKTGDLIWSCAGKGDKSAYCSPILIKHNGKMMLITMMAENVISIDPNNGKIQWTYPYANRSKVHPNSPIYKDGYLFIFSGYGKGGEQLLINPEGTQATNVWTNASIDNQMGGAILKNNLIYVSGQNNRKWFVLDWKTGQTKYETKDLDKGTIIEADDMLYAYTEKGELALLQPQADSIKIVGKTMITMGTLQHWAHLVIKNGVLYVRHGNALMAYNIRKK